MAPVTIAVGFKADGSVTHLYTGHNALDALDKIEQAGKAQQIIRGEVYHAPTPIRTRDFTDGTARDGGAANDEAARMHRINALKELTHEEIAILAQKYCVKIDGQPADEKAVKKSMQTRMYTIVAIYNAEIAEGVTQAQAEAAKLAAKIRTDEEYLAAAKERTKALEQLSDADLLTRAADHEVPIIGLGSKLTANNRSDLILQIVEKELPAPNKTSSGTVTSPGNPAGATGLPPRGLGAK